MRRHGNGGELLEQVEDSVRAVGEGLGHTFTRVRDGATDVGGRAVDFTKDHPLAILGSMAVGVGIGFVIARMLQR